MEDYPTADYPTADALYLLSLQMAADMAADVGGKCFLFNWDWTRGIFAVGILGVAPFKAHLCHMVFVSYDAHLYTSMAMWIVAHV